MAYAPIAYIAGQYEDYENWWLKCYQQGTTTPLTMATDSGGGTTAAKFEINSNGYLKTSGGAIVIPHIDQAYDAWIFPTEAEADANDTTNALQLADNAFNSAGNIIYDGTTIESYLDTNLPVAADGRLQPAYITLGDEILSGATLRDAYVVGRDLVGSTNCHGFADRTVISGVTDSGTYGVFDGTVELQGSHTQDHVYVFQDRTDYSGTGTLTNMAGLYSAPVFSGTGTITNRYGAEVRDVSKTGGGTLSANIGVYIRDLSSGSSNVAINFAQTTGYGIFAGGGAKSYHKGQFGIGVDNTDNAALALSNSQTGGSVTRMVLDTGATTGTISVVGDKSLELGINAGTRWRVTGSSSSYSIEPATNNSYDIGTASSLVRDVKTYGVTLGPGGVIWRSGTGTPEGAITAPAGSLFSRTDGGAGTSFYVKESGSGNTGWVAK